jgi:hypothetical protein
MEKSNCSQPSVPTVARLPNIGLMVDLGRQQRRQVKRLKRGDGALTHQIQTAVDRARGELGIGAASEIVPVVLLYRRGETDYVVITPQTAHRREQG